MSSPSLIRSSLSYVSAILSFSIFERVEMESPVRALTSARVQPRRARIERNTAPGLALERLERAGLATMTPRVDRRL